MKKFNGYEETQVFEGGQALTEGGKILKIIGAKVESYPNCDILKVAYDIVEGAEGEKDYFKTKHENDKKQDAAAKWKGVFDVFLPKDDESDNDKYTKQAFKRFTTSVEKSNSGYTWNWDEKSLTGKFFGGVFGKEEFQTKDGDYKFAVKCRFANSVDTIKEGKFKIPEPKMTKEHREQKSASNQNISTTANYQEIPDTDGVPF